MVNEPEIDAERALVLSYAPAEARAGLAALLALDDRLGAIVRRASDPTIGLMRLTWWAEALAALDSAPPPAEPLLQALAEHVAPVVGGAQLAGLVDGWDRLLADEPLDLEAFGRERGGGLFAAGAAVLGVPDAGVEATGEGWAMADLAWRWRDSAVAADARRSAEERLREGLAGVWPRRLRALGALALLARSDLAGGRPGSPARVGRLAWHRLTGR